MKFLVLTFFILVISACTAERTVLAANGEPIQGSRATSDLENTNAIRIKSKAPEQVHEGLEKLGLNEYQHHNQTLDAQHARWFGQGCPLHRSHAP